MSGASNDFIIFDVRGAKITLHPAQISLLCDRKVVGCDQLVMIKPSSRADCAMEIYNSDGSLASACGNATRCVAALIFEESGQVNCRIETASGILECAQENDPAIKSKFEDQPLISVKMGTPKFETLSFHFEDRKFAKLEFGKVDVGNPHCITFLATELSDADFFYIGPKIEHHFPGRTNVEFAQIINPDLIEVRVWERGAGETLACGSGACAVAALAIKKQLTTKNEIMVRFKGGDLLIRWKGKNDSIIMTGSYQKIFEGRLL